MKYWLSLIFRLMFVFTPVGWIYALFSYPTIYLVSLFFNSVIQENVLVIGSYSFTFIEACIAPYAYYFILLLVLFCKDLTLILRLKLIAIGWLLIFWMNVFRIVVIIFLTLQYGMDMFNIVHMIWWQFLSGIYIALVWIFLVWKYKIRETPIYDDVKYLMKIIRVK